jgi:hypothetical protein
MNYLLLIEWANCDKTWESFFSLKEAKAFLESHKNDENVEYMEVIPSGERIEWWLNPHCCEEKDGS